MQRARRWSIPRFRAVELRDENVAYRDAITLRGLTAVPVGLTPF